MAACPGCRCDIPVPWSFYLSKSGYVKKVRCPYCGWISSVTRGSALIADVLITFLVLFLLVFIVVTQGAMIGFLLLFSLLIILKALLWHSVIRLR